MIVEAFEIVTLLQEGPRQWIAAGRAYIDISLRDKLESEYATPQGLLVIGIETYGKKTDLLSAMMTGTLILEGELQVDEGAPKFFFTVK